MCTLTFSHGWVSHVLCDSPMLEGECAHNVQLGGMIHALLAHNKCTTPRYIGVEFTHWIIPQCASEKCCALGVILTFSQWITANIVGRSASHSEEYDNSSWGWWMMEVIIYFLGEELAAIWLWDSKDGYPPPHSPLKTSQIRWIDLDPPFYV